IVTLSYNPYLLILLTINLNFIVISIQTNNTLGFTNTSFLVYKDKALTKALFIVKAK
ncbi:hypothetical protein GQ607_008114, partial [Colletotrichum asianum]